MEDQFYVIQSGWVGNSMLFWRNGRAGYTTDFDSVHKFTLEEAQRTVRTNERIFSWDELNNLTVRNIIPDIIPNIWDHEIEKQ